MSIVPVDANWIVPGGVLTNPGTTVTTAVSGKPGFFLPADAPAPESFSALSGVTPEPTTAWVTGEYVRLGDDSLANWNGTQWKVGVAGSTVVNARLPVDYRTPGWAPEWMVGRDETYDGPKVDEIARRYDVIVSLGGQFTTWIPRMRAVNPNIQVLVYQLGPFASPGEAGTTAATSWPEEWFTHSSTTIIPPDWEAISLEMSATPKPRIQDVMRRHKGNRIMTELPFETFLMDPGNAGWRAESTRRAVAAANRYGYHGVLLDSMGQGAMNVGYVDAAAINQATRAPYTQVDWNAASAQQVRAVRAAAPNFFVTINGLGNSGAYGQTKVIGYEADLAMAERWLRDPHASLTAFPTAAVLKASIDMMIDMEANGKGGFASCTKLWTTPQPTVSQQNQWFQYAQAAFMCGTNGESRMFFIKDGAAPASNQGQGGSALGLQPSPDLNIGTPTGPYTQTGGAFVRQFTNGYVVVNGPASTQGIVLPSGTYTRSDNGQTASGALIIPANTGVVFTKV